MSRVQSAGGATRALRDDEAVAHCAFLSKALASCPHPIARNALERLSVDPVESVATFARAQLGG